MYEKILEGLSKNYDYLSDTKSLKSFEIASKLSKNVYTTIPMKRGNKVNFIN